MAILITYPEDKFNDELLAGLKKWSPLFLPLKRIEYNSWNARRYQIINDSDCVVVTSMLAVQALLKSDVSTDKQIAVISQKAAALLRSFHFNNIVFSKVENRFSLIETLNSLFDKNNKIVFLKSNLAPALPVQAQVTNLEVYKNVWSKADQERALSKIGNQDFTKVLITSPSEFYRFEAIEEKIPSQFMSAQYYTLGMSTQKVMHDIGFEAYAPKYPRNVLKQVVLKMTRESDN